MQTFCPMRLKDFPFDTQECEIALSSWIYDVRQLRIVPHPEDASEVNQTNLIIYCQKQQLGDNSP